MLIRLSHVRLLQTRHNKSSNSNDGNNGSTHKKKSRSSEGTTLTQTQGETTTKFVKRPLNMGVCPNRGPQGAVWKHGKYMGMIWFSFKIYMGIILRYFHIPPSLGLPVSWAVGGCLNLGYIPSMSTFHQRQNPNLHSQQFNLSTLSTAHRMFAVP